MQTLLQKHDGRLFRSLPANAAAQEERRDGDRRHAVTEILFFASVGDIKRMHGLCLVHDISVSPAVPGSLLFCLQHCSIKFALSSWGYEAQARGVRLERLLHLTSCKHFLLRLVR